MKNIFRPTATKRIIFFLIVDTLIFSISLYLSLFLRFDFDLEYLRETGYLVRIFYWLPVFVFLKLIIFYLNRLYFVTWRFVSLEEFFRITISLIIFLILISIFNYFFIYCEPKYFVPRSIPLTDFFISLVLVSITRVSKRFYYETFKNKINLQKRKNAIILGAGSTGERIVRELLYSKDSIYYPVGFLDDDETKQKIYIHNIPVLGKLNDLESILYKEEIDILIIAIPSLYHKKIKNIYEISKRYNVEKIKIVPSINNLPEDIISIKDLRDINLEDLLAREPVDIDSDFVASFLKDRTVFVTGAAGSIGSEIVRQLIKFKPKKIIAYEIDETEIHNLRLSVEQYMRKLGQHVEIEYIVGDVKDIVKLGYIFERSYIDVVFHAAAYKHVPLMEFFPEEAVRTNIFGTYNLVKLSIKYGVYKFVNISTDKAVNPTSVMGATKRMAEMVCSVFDQNGDTRFVSVRFGNVLGSRGSVIPIFLEQIRSGGPVTVTHPDMKRYFMTIPEAVLLVFQAAAMGEGGEVFVLDMGKPVKIVTLAEELIKLNGLEPYRDIEIVFTGLRPGEKLFEELLTAEEGTMATKHSKIYRAKTSNNLKIDDVENYIHEIEIIVEKGQNNRIREKLEEIIPFYKSSRI